MSPATGRRITDTVPEAIHRDEKTAEEISALIRDESDPHWRVLLTLIQQMNGAIMEDAALTRVVAGRLSSHEQNFEAHKLKFDEHIAKEAEIISKSIGAWRVVAILGPVVTTTFCALLLYIFSLYAAQLNEEMKENKLQSKELADLRRDIDLNSAAVVENRKMIDFILRQGKYGAP